MAAVSLEAESGKTSAEELRADCAESDRAEQSLSEENADSVGDSAEDRSDELYDVEIDSGEESADGKGLEREREDDGVQKESGVVVRSSGNDEAQTAESVNKDGRETPGLPEEGGDARAETKVMWTRSGSSL